MLLVENDLNTSSIFLNQKLNYIKATQFITNEFNIDSAMLYLQFNYQDELLDNQELYRLLHISPHTLDNITSYKVNKSIPFNERYETIDFIPKI